MKILVTGAAGFIGFHTCLKLVNQGHEVYGIDNINDYYDPKLKFDRLKVLGFNENTSKLFKNEIQSAKFNSLRFSRIDLVDYESIDNLFKQEQFEVVCNLAAQAGVRYSIENPKAYIDSNISGFLNILEGCRNHKVKHLVYASSSSVYGENKKVPFKTSDNVDHPISLYAATKKSNELMAHTYGHLYGFKTTGLRFFTVYGPWGRPDMAPMLFAKAAMNNDTIEVFNHGRQKRDFTYIGDIVEGIFQVAIKPGLEGDLVLNIGNGKPTNLLTFISKLEHLFNKNILKNFVAAQPGDVDVTYADMQNFNRIIGMNTVTDIDIGLERFVEWYKSYYL